MVVKINYYSGHTRTKNGRGHTHYDSTFVVLKFYRIRAKDLYIYCIYTSYMTTEMITLKLDDMFLKEIDSIVEKQGYHNRTEFIRNALREKVEETKLKEAMIEIAHLKGASKKKTSDEQLEKVRQKVFEELDRKVR